MGASYSPTSTFQQLFQSKKVPLIEWGEGLYNEYPIQQSHKSYAYDFH